MTNNDKWLDAMFEIRHGRRYHDHRLGFYEAAHGWGAIVACMMALASLVPSGFMVTWVFTLVLIASVLIISSAHQKARHHILSSNMYNDLERESIGADQDSDGGFVRLHSRLQIVRKRDRGRMPVIDLLTYNELVMSYTEYEHLPVYTVPWYKRFFGGFLRLGVTPNHYGYMTPDDVDTGDDVE